MTKNELNKWLEALRSGKYKQGGAALHQVNSKGKETFCCLGVYLKAVKGKKGVKKGSAYSYDKDTQYISKWKKDFYSDDGRINPKYEEDEDYSSLAYMNDDGLSFKKIAEIIEKDPEKYVKLSKKDKK